VDRLLTRMAARPGRTPVAASADAAAPPPAGEEQTAWVTLLEVLLNEPGLLAAAAETRSRVSRIVDARDRSIVGVVFELSDSLGEFRVGDVLARFHEAADVERVMELARRGARRGNYEGTLRVAVERIRRGAQRQELDESRSLAARPSDAGGGAADGRAQLERIAAGLRDYRGFAPPRKVRETQAATAADVRNPT
jgi:hypothetical protein